MINRWKLSLRFAAIAVVLLCCVLAWLNHLAVELLRNCPGQ
jgi:hypothetical protein